MFGRRTSSDLVPARFLQADFGESLIGLIFLNPFLGLAAGAAAGA
jgi:uncharacterized membrane protein